MALPKSALVRTGPSLEAFGNFITFPSSYSFPSFTPSVKRETHKPPQKTYLHTFVARTHTYTHARTQILQLPQAQTLGCQWQQQHQWQQWHLVNTAKTMKWTMTIIITRVLLRRHNVLRLWMRNVFKRAHKLHSQNGRQKEQTYLIAIKKEVKHKSVQQQRKVSRKHIHTYVFECVNVNK